MLQSYFPEPIDLRSVLIYSAHEGCGSNRMIDENGQGTWRSALGRPSRWWWSSPVHAYVQHINSRSLIRAVRTQQSSTDYHWPHRRLARQRGAATSADPPSVIISSLHGSRCRRRSTS